MLVIDVSFAIEASLAPAAFDRIRTHDPIAPPLMWSEATSVLREMQWRGAISPDLAAEYDAEYVALAQLLDCPLLTTDAKLARGAAAGARIIGPADP